MTKTIMQTFSGGPFNILEPDPSHIRVIDIAEALSKINRFSGHTVKPYSVAQHSIIVSGLLEGTGFELEGLLHDASEAYTGDISSPCKRALAEVAGDDVVMNLELPIQKAIATCFGLRFPWPEAVHQADHDALALERRIVLHPSTGVSWGSYEVPPVKLDGHTICEMSQTDARDAFLVRFNHLMLRRAQKLRDEKRPAVAS